jgi:hypothetical protein
MQRGRVMADDRLKNFIGAAHDLEMRARDVIDGHTGAREALVIALKNFGVANQSLETAAVEMMAAQSKTRRSGRKV